MRGPLLYCAEQADNGADLNAFVVATPAAPTTEAVADLDGAVAVTVPALREDAGDWGPFLYRRDPATRQPAALRLVPYHLWANRAPGAMLVWMRRQ